MGKEIVVKEETVKPLSSRERMLRAELERRIVAEFGAFHRVGMALAEINEGKLYRETHRTFETYCKDLWDMGRGYAYKVIGAAEVYEHIRHSLDGKVCTTCTQNEDEVIDLLPINEAQVRPLTRLKPDQQVAIWRSVVESSSATRRKVTASMINKVVKKYLGEATTTGIRNTQARLQHEHVSADFKASFDALLDQVVKEKEAGYKTTPKTMILKYVDSLRAILTEGDTQEELHGLPENLRKAIAQRKDKKNSQAQAE